MTSEAKKVGEIVWVDLTIPNAEVVRDFYQSVTGWGSSEFEMDGYSDYEVTTPEGDTSVAGICHARGANAELPPHWIVHVKVEDLEASREACRRLGGEVLSEPRQYGAARYCLLKDPAGAVFGVIEGDQGDEQ